MSRSLVLLDDLENWIEVPETAQILMITVCDYTCKLLFVIIDVQDSS